VINSKEGGFINPPFSFPDFIFANCKKIPFQVANIFNFKKAIFS